jgi:hypothetical protein
MAGLRVCRTHPELYKDPPLWFGTELNWTDINKMPSDIDPMSTFRERSAEHWVWRDFVFLRITTPTDLLLPPPYFLPDVPYAPALAVTYSLPHRTAIAHHSYSCRPTSSRKSR